MVRADLEANLLVAFRHHRIGEAGRENAPLAQVRNQRQGALSVADQQRHETLLQRYWRVGILRKFGAKGGHEKIFPKSYAKRKSE